MPKRNPQTPDEIAERRRYNREHARRWRNLNRARYLKNQRAWREKNRERIRAQAKARYARDIEEGRQKASARVRAYLAAHPEKRRERKRKFRDNNPDAEKNWRCYAKKAVARRVGLLPRDIPDDLADATLAYLRVKRELGETHCKNGHERTSENTYRDKDGFRRCRECNREKARRNMPRYLARKGAAQ